MSASSCARLVLYFAKWRPALFDMDMLVRLGFEL